MLKNFYLFRDPGLGMNTFYTPLPTLVVNVDCERTPVEISCLGMNVVNIENSDMRLTWTVILVIKTCLF